MNLYNTVSVINSKGATSVGARYIVPLSTDSGDMPHIGFKNHVRYVGLGIMWVGLNCPARCNNPVGLRGMPVWAT